MRIKIGRIVAVLMAAAIVLTAIPFGSLAVSAAESTESNLRRPVSNEQPLWIVHIDTWNTPDPEAIIALVPDDLKPYVVFNISLSINWDTEKQRFMIVEYGYETAKSWVRACAEQNVWCMIQPASGGQCHFPDYDTSVDYEDTVFAEFFRDYPNFIGYNYCEQFWGFDQADFPVTAEERYQHFAGLLELCNKYGGFLVDSWCANQWSPPISPIAMLKNVPEFEQACKDYTENFILLEKYTQVGYISDVESLVEGIWLSGYCGNFGIRYDDTGWTDSNWVEGAEQTKNEYRSVTSLAVYLERFLLNGATVIDGPEIIWSECFRETEQTTSDDGYTTRNWDIFEQFDKVTSDFFRQVVNGTIRIPTREEVIKRTKVMIVNDVETGNDDAKYSTPLNLTEGLYRVDGDGGLKDNNSIYKKTGRYPTIPMTTGFADEELEELFEDIIYKSDYNTTFPAIEDKVEYFNELFPEEYTGNIYAGNYENRWVVYCPYKEVGADSEGEIQLKYNTCDTIGLELPRYSHGIITEYTDGIDLYLNNYDEDTFMPATEVITITGCSEEPTYTYEDRGISNPDVTAEYSNGTFTLTVKHVGPMDISIKCSGDATDRETEYQEAVIVEPDAPALYEGTLQHEAEVFEYMNIDRIVTNGANEYIRDYTGQGYMHLGNNEGMSVRDSFKVLQNGTYEITLRYRSDDVNTIGVSTGLFNSDEFALADTNDEWQTVSAELKLDEGDNLITLKADGALSGEVCIDNITVTLLEASSGGVLDGVSSSDSGIMPVLILCIAVVAVVLVVAIVVIASASKKSKKK